MDMLLPYEAYRLRYATKFEALYRAMRDCIIQGKLVYGDRLPSTRDMAKMYGVSRGMVTQVFDTLASEGVVEGEAGRGTFVSYRPPESRASDMAQTGRNAEPIHHVRLSAWGEQVARLPVRPPEAQIRLAAPLGREEIRFHIGEADLSSFPFREWNKLLFQEVREASTPFHQEAFHSQGHRALREGVAAHLKRARGVEADPDRIVIVNGSMQAIALLNLLLVQPGDPVGVEEPSYSGTRRAIHAQGGRLVPLPSGPCGLQVKQLHERNDDEAEEAEEADEAVGAEAIRLLFVTPNRQFPTGAVMPLTERLELLQWADRQGVYVVEDDYDSEFRHRGKPLEPLAALDHSGRTIYLGSFSKTMPAEMRIGYVLLPEELVMPFVKAKQLFEPHPTALMEQRALARFLQSGQYERHLRRMKRVYGSKFHLLRRLLHDRLSGLFELTPSDAGLHLFAWWRGERKDWEPYRERCREEGVSWSETEHYFAGGPEPSACFGFSHLSPEELEEGVERLVRAQERLLTRNEHAE